MLPASNWGLFLYFCFVDTKLGLFEGRFLFEEVIEMDIVRDLWMQLEICLWKQKRRVVSLTSERTMPFLLIQ